LRRVIFVRRMRKTFSLKTLETRFLCRRGAMIAHKRLHMRSDFDGPITRDLRSTKKVSHIFAVLHFF
jgi:hypothetical protein